MYSVKLDKSPIYSKINYIVTKLKDFATEIIINPSKLTKYALNPNNDRGKHKAKVFKAILGYTKTNYEPLLTQIQTQALNETAHINRIDQYGHHLRVDLIITGKNNKQAVVRTGWLVSPNKSVARLTTLYVKEALE